MYSSNAETINLVYVVQLTYRLHFWNLPSKELKIFARTRSDPSFGQIYQKLLYKTLWREKNFFTEKIPSLPITFLQQVTLTVHTENHHEVHWLLLWKLQVTF